MYACIYIYTNIHINIVVYQENCEEDTELYSCIRDFRYVFHESSVTSSRVDVVSNTVSAAPLCISRAVVHAAAQWECLL